MLKIFDIFESTNCFTSANALQILLSMLCKNVLHNAKYIGRGMDKRCYVNDNTVYKNMICQKMNLFTILNEIVFLNLFFGKSFNVDLCYIKLLSNQYFNVVVLLLFLTYKYVDINTVMNFFSNFGQLYSKNTSYCTKHNVISFDLSYIVEFDPNILIDMLNFNYYDFNFFKTKYLSYLKMLKSNKKYTNIIISNVSSTNITTYNNEIFIYDINMKYL